MQNDPKPRQDADNEDMAEREDAPIPQASEDKVLDDTARMAREGRKQLESDPKERKPGSE